MASSHVAGAAPARVVVSHHCDAALIARCGISHVVHCAGLEAPACPAGIETLTLVIEADDPPTAVIVHFPFVNSWIDAAVAAALTPPTVLFYGRSTQPFAATLAAAYFMHADGDAAETAAQRAAAAMVTAPTLVVLADYERTLRGSAAAATAPASTPTAAATATVVAKAALADLAPPASSAAAAGAAAPSPANGGSSTGVRRLPAAKMGTPVVLTSAVIMDAATAASQLAASGRRTPPVEFASSARDSRWLLERYGAHRFEKDMWRAMSLVLQGEAPVLGGDDAGGGAAVGAPWRIYVGGASAANDRELLLAHGITHVVCCIGDRHARHRSDFCYAVIDVPDVPTANIAAHLDELCTFMHAALTGRGVTPTPTPASASSAIGGTVRAVKGALAAAPRKGATPKPQVAFVGSGPVDARKAPAILVHCQAGASRSVSVLVAFLVKHCGMTALEALRLVQHARVIANPNDGFRKQLLAWEQRCLEAAAGGSVIQPLATAVRSPALDVSIGAAAAAATATCAAAAAGDAVAGEADSLGVAAAAAVETCVRVAPLPRLTAAAAPYHTFAPTALRGLAGKPPTPPEWAAGELHRYDATAAVREGPPHDIPAELATTDTSKPYHIAHLVAPRILLGDIDAARDGSFLEEHGVTHIVSCVATYATGVKTLPGGRVVKTLGFTVDDDPSASIARHFEASIAFIHGALDEGPSTKVLVHCMAGVSRSASIVAAFLMKTAGLTALEAVAHIRKTRAIAGPNEGFLAQLMAYEQRLAQLARETAAATADAPETTDGATGGAGTSAP